MKTINEIYEKIKQNFDSAKSELNKVYGKANDFLKDFDFKSGVDIFMRNNRLVGEVNTYAEVVAFIEESGILKEENNLLKKNSRLGDIILEQDKEIEKLNKEIEYRHKLSTEIAQEEKIKDEALELACRRIDALMGNEDGEYVTDPFTFVQLAKEELEKGEWR